jgi:hypothetical protein
MNEPIIGGSLEIYGGNSAPYASNTGTFFGEGNSATGLNPGTGNFGINYTLIAQNQIGLDRVNLTFSDFNDPHQVRFYNTALNVAWQAETDIKMDLADFFYPIQSFSGYQKQTMIISPYTSILLDQGDFDTTLGEVGLLMAQAEYNVNTIPQQQILYWQYDGGPRYIMGPLLMLSGQVKNGQSWKGWQTSNDPSYEIGYTGAATGGFIFSNPTEYSIKLTVLTAS